MIKSKAHEHKGAQSQSLTDRVKSAAKVVAIYKASDFLNDHPALTLGLTLGMAMQSWEKEEPAIEGAVNEAAAGVETKVEAAEQELGTIFRSGGSNPGNLSTSTSPRLAGLEESAICLPSVCWVTTASTYFYAIRDPACCRIYVVMRIRVLPEEPFFVPPLQTRSWARARSSPGNCPVRCDGTRLVHRIHGG